MSFNRFCMLPLMPTPTPCQILPDYIGHSYHVQVSILKEHFKDAIQNLIEEGKPVEISSSMVLVLPRGVLLPLHEDEQMCAEGNDLVTGFRSVKLKSLKPHDSVVWLPKGIVSRVYFIGRSVQKNENAGSELRVFIEMANGLDECKSIKNLNTYHNTMLRVKLHEVLLLSTYAQFDANIRKFDSWKLRIFSNNKAEIVYGYDNRFPNFSVNERYQIDHVYSEHGFNTKNSRNGKEIEDLKSCEPHGNESNHKPINNFPNVGQMRSNYERTNECRPDYDAHKSNVCLNVVRELGYLEKEASRNEEFYSTELRGAHSSQGIQGFWNSCYADSVLFSMFAFTSIFDNFLTRPNETPSAEQIRKRAINKIIMYDIVTPLRKSLLVEKDAVLKLRNVLSFFNEDFKENMMDAEDFILALAVNVWCSKEFFQLTNNTTDFVYHIFTTKKIIFNGYPLLSKLLCKSFNEMNVKLESIPSPVFIIKLPVSNGCFMYKNVIPDLELDLKDILATRNHSEKTVMVLKAVICLNNGHYTCCVRTENGILSKWVYADSKPGSPSPKISVYPYMSEFLDNPKKMYDDNQPNYEFILENAYICIYERPLD